MGFSNLQDSDWRNLLYLVLILTMLLAGLFSRRNLQYAKIFKYFAAWSGIALVIIALYAYRYEFSDFKARIIGEINPSAPKIGKHGELIINLAEDGHFYLDLKINGVASRFMIDTGASEITISLAEAKRIGVDVKKLNFNRPYQTANGMSFGASVTLEKIEVGNVKFYDVPASINSSDMGISLLGMSFLRQFNRYEFYRDKLILEI